MDKSPDAFRTISEVAEDLSLPQHVLRFWETRFNQIRPLKRGGGRRYYRPDDVDLLKGIRHLLYGEGYTIKGVQRILKAEGVRFVQGVGRGEEIVVAAPPEMREAASARIPRRCLSRRFPRRRCSG
jgi:DNA-binding transcriptional MerR regulator